MKRLLLLLLPLLSACTSGNVIQTDVLVVGGGTAGTVSAIQAARSGVDVVLVESGPQLGGTMTSGGVCFPGLFHAWGKQIISGIGWELVSECASFNGDTLPDFTVPCGSNHPAHQIRLNAPLYSALAEEKCLQAGVNIHYLESLVKVERKRKRWLVETLGRGGESTFYFCSSLVDATGNATAAALAGYERVRDENVNQPGSLIFTLCGYDPQSLDYDMIQRRMDEAKADGIIRQEDCYAGAQVLLADRPGLAVSHVLGADSSTSAKITSANIEGRTSLLRLIRFLRTIPGLEGLTIKTMQAETAVRETYRIKGVSTITGEDYVGGRSYPDAICFSYYPIDLHDANGVEPRHLEEGTVPAVPLGALIPQGSKHLIVAGRCVSSDRIANSALRVQATCMATGQAAGAAAALSVRHSCDISNEEGFVGLVRDELNRNGAILP